jgi:hypothetical protein
MAHSAHRQCCCCCYFCQGCWATQGDEKTAGAAARDDTLTNADADAAAPAQPQLDVVAWRQLASLLADKADRIDQLQARCCACAHQLYHAAVSLLATECALLGGKHCCQQYKWFPLQLLMIMMLPTVCAHPHRFPATDPGCPSC